jgi:3-methyl-2-oxobutanoate hydroxymethyltransferase
MGADELRSIVKQLWKQSAAEGRTTTQGSISAPAEVARVTKGAVSDFQEAVDGRKDITIVDLQKMRDNLVPITMCTAYDYPSAVHVDLAGIDVLLVGDSVGMVVLGFDTTLPVSFEEMLHHCRAVSRGCKRPLLVGDLPFGSYEVSAEEAQRNAYRLLKEGSMEAVKLEGADSGRLRTVEVLVRGGIAVMGHIGLTPQSYSTLGGFRAQGRHARQAVELVAQAKRLESAGIYIYVPILLRYICVLILLRCVCPHTAQVYMCPRTSQKYLCPHTRRVCRGVRYGARMRSGGGGERSHGCCVCADYRHRSGPSHQRPSAGVPRFARHDAAPALR